MDRGREIGLALSSGGSLKKRGGRKAGHEGEREREGGEFKQSESEKRRKGEERKSFSCRECIHARREREEGGTRAQGRALEPGVGRASEREPGEIDSTATQLYLHTPPVHPRWRRSRNEEKRDKVRARIQIQLRGESRCCEMWLLPLYQLVALVYTFIRCVYDEIAVSCFIFQDIASKHISRGYSTLL